MKAVCHCEEDTLSHQRPVFLSTTTQTYCKHSFTNGMSAEKCNFWESLLGIRKITPPWSPLVCAKQSRKMWKIELLFFLT